MKPVSYKWCFAVLPCLLLLGCLSGTRPYVRLSPKLDKHIYQLTPLPLTVGVYIEPTLRNYIQKAPLKQDETGTPYYVFPDFIFPIGETLTSEILEMSHILFKKAVLLDSLQDTTLSTQEALDGILAVSLKHSEIKLRMESSVWRAIGRHNLSVTASFLDAKRNKVWTSEIAAEGKGLDFVTTRVEYEWWMTTGPKFGPAVDDAIQKLTYALAQKIAASKEIADISHPLK